ADLELVVVDDGSTDATAAILALVDDPRLRVIGRPAAGLAASLNAAIRASTASLVARMDADDLCEPERLERQVAFLDRHPDHVLVGSDVLVVAEDGSPVHTA